MIEKVRDWLNTQGFPLEMRAAAAFRTAGFDVMHSTHYLDSETGKQREVDVLARDPDHLGILGISFVIECKATKKPWVLLCSTHTLAFGRVFAFAVTSDDARAVLAENIVELLDKLPWLRKDDLTGYSLRQAFSENDVAYTATMNVAKASQSCVHGGLRFSAQFGFAFPVIVVDSPLIRCCLGENDELHLEETDQGEFLAEGACIRVVTIGRLPAFALEAKRVADQIRAEFKVEVERVRASWYKKASGTQSEVAGT